MAQLRLLSRFDPIAVDLHELGTDQSAKGSLIVAMADRVYDAKGSAEVPAILIGHSMGCRVVPEASRRQPNAVAGLVLIEGSRRAVGNADVAVRGYLSRPVEENKALLMRDFAGMFSNVTPASFRESVLQRANEMDSDYAVRLMADMTLWDASEAPAALSAVRAPMLVMQSTYKKPGGKRRSIGLDEISPWLQLVNEQAARARIVRMTGLGHFPQVEVPERISRMIADFVDTLASVELEDQNP